MTTLNIEQGNVYVKCPSINCAVAAVNALHGRWFAGKVTQSARKKEGQIARQAAR